MRRSAAGEGCSSSAARRSRSARTAGGGGNSMSKTRTLKTQRATGKREILMRRLEGSAEYFFTDGDPRRSGGEIAAASRRSRATWVDSGYERLLTFQHGSIDDRIAAAAIADRFQSSSLGGI